MGKNKNTPSLKESRNGALAVVMQLFVLAILCVFPVVYHDYYFDILKTKYMFYYISVLIMLAVALGVFVFFRIVGEDKKQQTVRFSWKALTWPEWSMVAFLVVAACSTLFSEYRFESFWGNEGRYTGLFLLMLYGAGFFLVSRYLNFKNWLVDAFLVVGLLVCLFGITDYFSMDLFGFKANMKPEQIAMFTSTLGNINTYTAYVALVMGVSAALFAACKSPWRTVCYYVVTLVSFFAIIMGISDNAYLAIAALFAFLPLYLFSSKEGLRRYLILTATFFSVIQVIDWLNGTWADRVLGIDGLFQVIAMSDKLIYLVAGLWVLVIAAYGIHFNKKGADDAGKWPRRTWLVLLAVIVAGAIGILLDANLGGHSDRYGALSNYLVFNDDWGTHRGYIWRIGMESYMNFPPLQKLFGYGPDTFGIVTTASYYQEMTSRYGEVFDSAHNEYLQYFVTIGPLGLLSYLSLLISSGIRMVKRAGQNPYIVALLFAVICYGAQAFVNINLPIAAPIMWMLLTVGVAGSRK